MGPLPLLAISAIGKGLQGLATIGAGRLEGKAAANRAQAARIEAEMANIRGIQVREASRQELQTVLGSIGVTRSTRGMSLDSATGQAIDATTRQDLYRREAIAALAERQRQGAALSAAQGYQTAARWALPLSVLQSGGQFAQAADTASMMWKR